MKRSAWLWTLLLMTLLFALAAPSAAAKNLGSGNCGANGKNVTWVLNDDGVMTVRGSGKMKDYPEMDTVPWVKLRDKIETVKVESGVTHIGECAFYHCNALNRLSLPSGLKSIAYGAFWGTNCKTVVIPKSVSSIGDRAFHGAGIEKFQVESGNKSFSADKYGCLYNKDHSTLIHYPAMNTQTSFTLPASVKKIESEALAWTYNLKEIKVHKKNTAFSADKYGCLYNKKKTVLIQYPLGNTRTTFTVPAKVKRIGDAAFADADYLKRIVLQNKVTEIGQWAFFSCSELEAIGFPSSLKSLAWQAFSACDSLSVVKIPASMKTISERAFEDCGRLKYILYTGSKSNWKSLRVEKNNQAFKKATVYYVGKNAAQFGVCGASENNLVWYLSGKGLLTINGRGKMKSGDHPAQWGKKVLSVVINNGVTSIPAAAFSACKNMRAISIPASVNAINDTAFQNCVMLKKITVNKGNKKYCSDANGCLYNKEKTILIQYPGRNTQSAFTLPQSVKTIKPGAFKNCAFLKNLTLTSGLKEISSGLFSGCKALTKINIPASVVSGSNAFKGCKKLQNVTIASGVKAIGTNAFQNCTALKSIQIPASAAVGSKALSNVSISDGVKTIGDHAFQNCTALKSILIPSSVQALNETAFLGCSALQEIKVSSDNEKFSSDQSGCLYDKPQTTLLRCPPKVATDRFVVPDSVTTIRAGAFQNCTALTEIELPAKLKAIESSAFDGCKNLKSVFFHGTQAQWSSVSIQTFKNDLLLGADLTVEKATPHGIQLVLLIVWPLGIIALVAAGIAMLKKSKQYRRA